MQSALTGYLERVDSDSAMGDSGGTEETGLGQNTDWAVGGTDLITEPIQTPAFLSKQTVVRYN